MDADSRSDIRGSQVCPNYGVSLRQALRLSPFFSPGPVVRHHALPGAAASGSFASFILFAMFFARL